MTETPAACSRALISPLRSLHVVLLDAVLTRRSDQLGRFQLNREEIKAQVVPSRSVSCRPERFSNLYCVIALLSHRLFVGSVRRAPPAPPYKDPLLTFKQCVWMRGSSRPLRPATSLVVIVIHDRVSGVKQSAVGQRAPPD